MTGLVEVFFCVPMRARVAAADVAAGQAHAQMRPRALAEFRALLTLARRKRFGLNDVGREVLTRFGDRRGVRIAPT
jgi:hypothetical protein